MPRTGITVYDLLLSCPGDVLDLKPIIEECVKSFNSSIGEINNIRIELKHWSTDSFPQSGDKPQNILNKQFVNDCDLCIALLGIRFGTPTDNYDSGTEEEIENMLAQGKQVFLYFVERNVDPSKIDVVQYGKVKKFKEKYTDKGVYATVKTAEDLRKEFQNALTLYFIKLVSPTATEAQPNFSPILKIVAAEMEDDTIILQHSNFQNVQLVENKEKKIINAINEIKALIIEKSQEEHLEKTIPSLTDEEVKKMRIGELSKAFADKKITIEQYYNVLGKELPSISKVEIQTERKELIVEFCNNRGIILSEEFWDLGNLQKEISIPLINFYGTNSTKFKGTDSEQKKYELINNLISSIREYNEVIEYFKKIDKLYNVSFVVDNSGTTFDEDIDIKIFVDKGHITKVNDIPIPGLRFLNEVVECEAPKLLFAGYHNSDIVDYSNYPKITPYVSEMIPSPFSSTSDEIEKNKRKYKNLVEDIFCYEIYETDDEDILCFNIPYLKQNTKMFFPSFLFFNTIPTHIRYEIRSKHSPNVYSRKFNIKNKD